MGEYTKQQYYKYSILRDEHGDNRAAKDILDFPAVCPEKDLAYGVFLDTLGEKFLNRELLVLQEYGDFLSPMGGPLCEGRLIRLKSLDSMEDFINPLDEPSKILPDRYATQHTFLYKDGEELRMVRLSENKKEGMAAVRETLYDVTDIPFGERKVFASHNGYIYHDRFKVAVKYLKEHGCSLGNTVGNSLLKIMENKFTEENGKDKSLPGLVGNMDVLLSDTGMLSDKETGALRQAMDLVYNSEVGLYTETEYFQYLLDKDGKLLQRDNTGVEGSLARYNSGWDAIWQDVEKGKSVSVGLKDGNLAVRVLMEEKREVFPDGNVLVDCVQSIKEVFPLGKKELASFREVNNAINNSKGFFIAEEELLPKSQGVIKMSSFLRSLRKKVEVLIPEKAASSGVFVFGEYMRKTKKLPEKKLMDKLESISFQPDRVNYAIKTKQSLKKKRIQSEESLDIER